MWAQQRIIMKITTLIQMNSRTSFYISGIFMISCIFLVTVEKFLVTVGLKRFYVSQKCVQWWNKANLIREVFTRCTEEFPNIVCIGVSTLPPPSKTPPPSFLPSPPYFLCKNCNTPEKSHPLFPSNPTLKIGILSRPPF